MALIKCKECGNTISDQATACPVCGCPNIKGHITIHVLNIFSDIEIYIDNKLIGTIQNKKIIELDIEKDCTIIFKTQYKDKEILNQFPVKSNEIYNISLTFDKYNMEFVGSPYNNNSNSNNNINITGLILGIIFLIIGILMMSNGTSKLL